MSLTEAQFAMIPGLGDKRASKIARVLDTRYAVWQQQQQSGEEQGKLEGEEAA